MISIFLQPIASGFLLTALALAVALNLPSMVLLIISASLVFPLRLNILRLLLPATFIPSIFRLLASSWKALNSLKTSLTVLSALSPALNFFLMFFVFVPVIHPA